MKDIARVHRRIRRARRSSIARSQCQALLRDAELTAGDLVAGARAPAIRPASCSRTILNARAQALGFAVAADHEVRRHDRSRRPTGSDPKLIAKPDAVRFRRRRRPGSRFAACSATARSSSRCGRSRASTTAISTPGAAIDPIVRQGRARRFATSPPSSPISRRIAATSNSVSPRVHHAVADDADLGGLDRPHLRQPARRPDPAPDPRHRRGRLRQSLRAGADATNPRATSAISARPSTR